MPFYALYYMKVVAEDCVYSINLGILHPKDHLCVSVGTVICISSDCSRLTRYNNETRLPSSPAPTENELWRKCSHFFSLFLRSSPLYFYFLQ